MGAGNGPPPPSLCVEAGIPCKPDAQARESANHPGKVIRIPLLALRAWMGVHGALAANTDATIRRSERMCRTHVRRSHPGR